MEPVEALRRARRFIQTNSSFAESVRREALREVDEVIAKHSEQEKRK